MILEEFTSLIKNAGFEAVERDSLYSEQWTVNSEQWWKQCIRTVFYFNLNRKHCKAMPSDIVHCSLFIVH
jgi:hypothetical protein